MPRRTTIFDVMRDADFRKLSEGAQLLGLSQVDPDFGKLPDDAKRAALKLPVYDASKWAKSGDARMQELIAKKEEERRAALYGMIHSHEHV